MNKTTKLILISVLLGSACALSITAAPAGPALHRTGHLRPGARFAEPSFAPKRKAAGKSATHSPVLLDQNYKIIDEPDADPSLYGTRVFGINEKGQISGQYVDSAGSFHAFLATPNGDGFDFTPISVKGRDTFVGFLNDRSEMFGTYTANRHTGMENAWIRLADGRIKKFAVSGATGGTFGQGLNNKGVLAGTYIDDNGVLHGFIRAKDGAVTLFDAPGAGTGADQGTEGLGINNLGEVSGTVHDSNDVSHGFVRRANGTFDPLIDVDGAGTGAGQGTEAIEIDDKGCVTGGFADSNDVRHGFIDCGGNFTIVDAPHAGTAPFQGTVAVEHLEAGWAIGEYIDTDGVYHGYFRKKNGSITEFDAPGAGDLGTYTVYQSNGAHLIAGTFKDENGIRHGFTRYPKEP